MLKSIQFKRLASVCHPERCRRIYQSQAIPKALSINGAFFEPQTPKRPEPVDEFEGLDGPSAIHGHFDKLSDLLGHNSPKHPEPVDGFEGLDGPSAIHGHFDMLSGLENWFKTGPANQ